MLRLLLCLFYLLLTVLCTSLVYVAVDDASEPVAKRLESEISKSHEGYYQIRRLREIQIRDVATNLANGEVQAYLGTVNDFRNRMLKLEAEVHGNFPSAGDELQAEREGYIRDKTGFLEEFSEALARRLEAIRGADSWGKDGRPTRADFLKSTQDTLVECNARNVQNCIFTLTFKPFADGVAALKGTASHGLNPDLAILSDDRGQGLCKADDDKWSANTKYAEQYALINKVRELPVGGVVRDVITFEGNDRYYFVAAAPIREGGAFRGAVMVGIQIDDRLLKDESAALGWDVSYIEGKSLIRSALPDELRSEMENNLPGRTVEAKKKAKKTRTLEIQYVPLTGNYANHDVMVAISGNRDELLAPIQQIKTYIPLFGAIMFLMGMGLFLWTVRTYTKPLVDIDTGIHEIMNGDHDYEFRSDYNDQLWSSMAQSLNRMVGILLGRELEDEDLEEYLGVKTRDSRSHGAGFGNIDEEIAAAGGTQDDA